jgi:hypothetical protein
MNIKIQQAERTLELRATKPVNEKNMDHLIWDLWERLPDLGTDWIHYQISLENNQFWSVHNETLVLDTVAATYALRVQQDLTVQPKTTSVDLESRTSKGFKKTSIGLEDIGVFFRTGSKAENDTLNNSRENIILALASKKIPNDWITRSFWWHKLQQQLDQVLVQLSQGADRWTINKKAGRSHHADFGIDFYRGDRLDRSVFVEFKHNISRIDKLPEFLSIASKHFCGEGPSYVETFYNGPLDEIAKLYGLQKPPKDLYKKYVYNSNYDKMEFTRRLKTLECTDEYKALTKKRIVNESIGDFLEQVDFNCEELSTMLQKTQQDKIFLMWDMKKRRFETDTLTQKELSVKKVHEIRNRNTLVLETESPNTFIHALLRWKNHAGILFPAWQISLRRVLK